MKLYLMEFGYYKQLLKDSSELVEYARTLSHAERVEGKKSILDSLAASNSIFITPKNGESVKLEIKNGRAQIPIIGELTPSAEKDICGGYTAQALTEYGFIIESIKAAEANESVKGIDFFFNSPGGYLNGLDMAAQAIAMTPLDTKGYVGDMAASAAYWLLSQVDHIEALSPVSRVGSIGVKTEEYNNDDALESEGIHHRVYTSTSAPNKHPNTNTKEGQELVIAELDKLHSVFVSRVAQGRNVSEEKVNKDFGQGGLLMAKDALKVGMIDSVKGENISRIDRIDSLAVGEAAGIPANTVRGEKTKMKTLEELKAENPELYAQAIAKGKEEGIKAEKTRQEELNAWMDVSPSAAKIAKEALVSGKSYSDVASQLSAASAKEKNGKTELDADNAPLVGSATHDAKVSGLTEDERKYCVALGINEKEYLESKQSEV